MKSKKRVVLLSSKFFLSLYAKKYRFKIKFNKNIFFHSYRGSQCPQETMVQNRKTKCKIKQSSGLCS